MRYLLDTNTFIEAKNRYYHFDVCPGFWDWLARLGEKQSILSVQPVKKELQQGNDELAKWVKDLPNTYFLDLDIPVQRKYKSIVEYVMNHTGFSLTEKSNFLAKADPWLIATAIRSHSTIITHEKAVGNNSKKIKIPNLCNHFKVPCLNIFELLQKEKVKFRLR